MHIYSIIKKKLYTHRIVCLIAGHLLPEMESDLLIKILIILTLIDLVYILVIMKESIYLEVVDKKLFLEEGGGEVAAVK